ncbi:multimodular transpeptidase-transglycosylase PbpC [soil metagenome]
MDRPPPDPPQPTIRADLAHRADLRARLLKALALTALGAAALLFGLVLFFLWRFTFVGLPPLPDADRLWSLNRPPGITFLDRNGAVIAVRGSRHGAAVRLRELPPFTAKAFLAAEDRRFYGHIGVDPVGIARAVRADLKAHRIVQGGSTITQQIARGLFLTPNQNLKRKFQEAVLAMQLESRLSKDAILELYLNRIYFGAGAYGIDAASRTYFGKDPRRLTLAEAALLASLPKAPTRLSPSNNLEAARRRAGIVLGLMRKEGWVDPAAEAQARAHPASLAPEPDGEGDLGYGLDLAAMEAKARAAGRAPDLVVRTTLDPALQRAAADAVRWAVGQGRSRGVTQAALIALAPDGSIAAVQGGLDHRDSPFDRATQALRQPGSAFKPFVYAAALEDGIKPTDVRADAPVDLKGWRPQNFERGYAGNVTLSDALARSINTVAVRLTQEVGPDKVASLARRFGITTAPVHAAPAIALGAYEVRLVELTGAYQVLQRGGGQTPPFLVTQVSDARGQVLWKRPDTPPYPVFDGPRALELTRMMQGVIEHGTGKRARLDRPAAGKTGTTQDSRDAWFVGYTPDWAAGVWLGDDRNGKLDGLTGGDLPALAWARFMTVAHAGLPVRDFGLTGAARVDPRAGFYSGLADELEAAAKAP